MGRHVSSRHFRRGIFTGYSPEAQISSRTSRKYISAARAPWLGVLKEPSLIYVNQEAGVRRHGSELIRLVRQLPQYVPMEAVCEVYELTHTTRNPPPLSEHQKGARLFP